MILKSGVSFEGKPIFCLKNDKNLVNLDPSTKKSLLCKVYNFSPKKVQRSYDTEESCKI